MNYPAIVATVTKTVVDYLTLLVLRFGTMQC